MYPFEVGHIFPKSQWSIAAGSEEVVRALFERTILEKRPVFCREEGGTPLALDGICPHCNLPLAQGIYIQRSPMQSGQRCLDTNIDTVKFSRGCSGQC